MAGERQKRPSDFPVLGIYVGMKLSDMKKIFDNNGIDYRRVNLARQHEKEFEVQRVGFEWFTIRTKRGLIYSINVGVYNTASKETIRKMLIEKYGTPKHDFDRELSKFKNRLSICWGDCSLFKKSNTLFSPKIDVECNHGSFNEKRFVYSQKDFCFGVQIWDEGHTIKSCDFSIDVEKKSAEDIELGY